MTPLGLTAMRRTATLLHAVPGLRARIVHEGRPLLEVLRPEHPGDAPVGRWLTPCAFRAAVARAVLAMRDGRTLAVLGLPPGVDPSVELGARNGQLLPGGIAEIATTAGYELGFVTTLRMAEVEAITGATSGRAAPTDAGQVRLHADPLTDAVLVVHTTPCVSPVSRSAALEQTQRLLARCAVAELVADTPAYLRSSTTMRPDA
ncbi:MAG TPA: hypothetical protein VF183_04055 [Acidimicrobiales bacterium]